MVTGAAASIALALVTCSGAALADDPNDPAMRTAAARARDHEMIRQLNLAQLAQVRQRDAGYQQGWDAVRVAGGQEGAAASYASQRGEYERAMAEHARDRDRYEKDMANWRSALAACRSGEWDYCER